MLQYQCEQLDKTFRWWFFNGSLVPGSANGHPTEKISEFVDFHLRPHVEALPSHLKDTTDYLQKMESMNPLPLAVTLICKKCSPLNVKLLCFSTNVSNKRFRWWFFNGSLVPGLYQTNPKSDASIYYLKFIKSTTPGDPLFQQMGTPQKKSPNSSISTFDLCRSITLTLSKVFLSI
jgi:hypothetical protein